MSVIILNQSVIHYESLGRGRPVLFLHTWVGSWRYWVTSLQAAAVSHSAYALDLFGFGESSREPSAYSIESQAMLVGAFMDQMGIERIALVGHGLGALVGLHFASANTRRIARFLGVGIPLERVSLPADLLTLVPDQLLELLAAKGSHADALLPETHAVAADAARLVPDADLIQGSIAALQASGAPVLVINGANDPLQPPPTPESHGASDPKVHEIVFPESGHFPMLDEADPFHRLMIDFLALETGTSPRELRLKEEWRRRVR